MVNFFQSYDSIACSKGFCKLELYLMIFFVFLGLTEKPGSDVRFFEGCLRLLNLGDNQKLHDCRDGNNIVFGCPTF